MIKNSCTKKLFLKYLLKLRIKYSRHTDTDLDISKFYEKSSYPNTRDVLLFFAVRIAVYTQLK